MGSSSQLRSYAVCSSLSQVQLRGFEVHGQRQCTLGTGIRRGGYDAPFNGSWWSMFECALREDDKEVRVEKSEYAVSGAQGS